MKILLINNNPVVSRLTALSARKEDVEIDEIQEVTELNADKYDIVFVDADAWSKDVQDVISENIKSKKSVLFYTEEDKEEREHFDISILKPFLPSEVSAVIRSVEEANPLDSEELFDLDVLDDNKISFDDKLEEAFPASKTSLEDDLFDNKSKVDLDLNLDDDLFDADPKIEFDLEDELLADDKKEKDRKENDTKEISKEIKLDDDLFDLDLSDVDDSLKEDKKSEDKKADLAKVNLIDEISLDDDLLEIDSDVKETLLDSESVLEVDSKQEEIKALETKTVETETKILDKSEIENIKGILEDDGASDDMTLDQLMPAIPTLEVSKEKAEKEKVKTEKAETEKVKKEKSKKIEDEDEFDGGSNVLMDSLASMPVESLKELLAGTKINIQIKFPKSK